jgi:hypothetical protein
VSLTHEVHDDVGDFISDLKRKFGIHLRGLGHWSLGFGVSLSKYILFTMFIVYTKRY